MLSKSDVMLSPSEEAFPPLDAAFSLSVVMFPKLDVMFPKSDVMFPPLEYNKWVLNIAHAYSELREIMPKEANAIMEKCMEL